MATFTAAANQTRDRDQCRESVKCADGKSPDVGGKIHVITAEDAWQACIVTQ